MNSYQTILARATAGLQTPPEISRNICYAAANPAAITKAACTTVNAGPNLIYVLAETEVSTKMKEPMVSESMIYPYEGIPSVVRTIGGVDG